VRVLRQQLFDDFRKKLYANHEAEELTILPRMLKLVDLRDLSLELEVEHADMKVHFEALMKEEYAEIRYSSYHKSNLPERKEVILPLSHQCGLS
jgi:hypothetical protein